MKGIFLVAGCLVLNLAKTFVLLLILYRLNWWLLVLYMILSSVYSFTVNYFAFFKVFDKLVLLFSEFFYLEFFCCVISKWKVFVCCSPFKIFTNLFYIYCCFMHLLFGTILNNNYEFPIIFYRDSVCCLVFVGFLAETISVWCYGVYIFLKISTGSLE